MLAAPAISGKLEHRDSKTVEMIGREPMSYDEILEAARRLPPGQRMNLVEDLTSVPSRSSVLKLARQLRRAFRLPANKQRRLSVLLQKGNAGELTSAQRTELDALIEDVLDKREEMANAIGEAVAGRKRSNSRNGTAGR
jgi:hypothetical protein